MTKVVGVRFKRVGKVYYFGAGDFELERGNGVIVETTRGIEYGICVLPPFDIEDEKVVLPLRPVIRRATEEDERTVEANTEKERRAFEISRAKGREHNLDMRFIDVEYTFDGSKILFYFTAEGRVDFRDLVKDLASVFRTRIELRQIGVRDEAKMLGGLGICGKPFCCATFLDEFQPVSIKMAKEQSLSLNPVKISGTCGRLMCCLKYEQDTYEHLIRETPPVDSRVATPGGPGTVTDVSLLRGDIKVRLDKTPDSPPKCFKRCDLCLIKKGDREVYTSVVQDETTLVSASDTLDPLLPPPGNDEPFEGPRYDHLKADGQLVTAAPAVGAVSSPNGGQRGGRFGGPRPPSNRPAGSRPPRRNGGAPQGDRPDSQDRSDSPRGNRPPSGNRASQPRTEGGQPSGAPRGGQNRGFSRPPYGGPRRDPAQPDGQSANPAGEGARATDGARPDGPRPDGARRGNRGGRNRGPRPDHPRPQSGEAGASGNRPEHPRTASGDGQNGNRRDGAPSQRPPRPREGGPREGGRQPGEPSPNSGE